MPMQATFQLNLETPANMTTLSNMPLVSHTVGNDVPGELSPGCAQHGARHFVPLTMGSCSPFMCSASTFPTPSLFPCCPVPCSKCTHMLALCGTAQFALLTPFLNSTHTPDGLARYAFQPSPPMPTYLVAWIVGELEHVAMGCETMNGVTPVAVWATADRWVHQCMASIASAPQ